MIKVPNLHNLYRRVTGSLLDATVQPHLLGNKVDSGKEPDDTDIHHPICYVLQEYSRSNASLIDNEAKRLGLHPPLDPIFSPNLKEKISTLFLEKNTDRYTYQQSQPISPRLQRLINEIETNPSFDIDLVPVTVLWGRAPENEDSWFKLLMTDAWTAPTTLKQIINLGVHRNQTYVDFHQPVSLRALYEEAKQRAPDVDPALYIFRDLFSFLSRQREIALGPDVADRRNVKADLYAAPAVKASIEQEVKKGVKLAKAQDSAKKYLEEIVADYSYPMIRFYDHVLSWLWTNLYDGVEVHNFQQVRQLADDYEIIYTPAHRSHVDYLLMSFVIYKRGMMVPYIAAGDNLNLPILGKVLRGGGAFFIRRSFKGNQLYTAVLREYVYSILKRNTPMECFIEGGRSRSGRLLPPKQGFLGLVTHAALRSPKGKPVVFIPTYFGYERLMEGGTYVGELQGKPKEKESLAGLLKATRKIERIFGKVHVSFGEPVFLDQVLRANHIDPSQPLAPEQSLPQAFRDSLNDIADTIMENINKSAVVNPVNLLSLVLLATPRHMLDESVLVRQIDTYRKLAELAPYDDHTQLTPLNGEEVLAYGQRLKMVQQVSHPMGNMIGVDPSQAVLLTYFRNNIIHLYILPSLIAAITARHGSLTLTELINLTQQLYSYFKAELFLKWEPEQVAEQIKKIVLALQELGLLRFDLTQVGEQLDISNDTLISVPDMMTETFKQLQLLSGPALLSLERYFVSLSVLLQQTTGVETPEQLEELSVLLGQKLSLVYEFNSPEFFDRNVFKTFIKTLIDEGLIKIGPNKKLVFDQHLEQLFDQVAKVLDPTTITTLKQVTAIDQNDVKKILKSFEIKKQKQNQKEQKAG